MNVYYLREITLVSHVIVKREKSFANAFILTLDPRKYWIYLK